MIYISTKRQHYIPCMLLKNWSLSNKGRNSEIYCYNIKTKQSYKTKVESICYENNLHEADELKHNSIEKYLSNLESTIWPYLINKCINNETLEENEQQCLYIILAHFFLRSSYLINNIEIDKSTYLLKSLVITKNNEQDILNQILNTMKNKYVIIGKTNKQFIINNVFSVIPISNDNTFRDCSWYFPISNDTCIIITNNKHANIDNIYILLDNDFVDYINSLFINTINARFIYSKYECDNYIESLKL